MFPLGFWEVNTVIDVLHTCVVDQHIYSTELFHRLINYLLAVGWLGQIGKNIDGFSVWVLAFELSNCLFDLFVRGESIEDDVVAFSGHGVGDSESDSTERASDECYFVIFSRLNESYLAMSLF